MYPDSFETPCAQAHGEISFSGSPGAALARAHDKRERPPIRKYLMRYPVFSVGHPVERRGLNVYVLRAEARGDYRRDGAGGLVADGDLGEVRAVEEIGVLPSHREESCNGRIELRNQ